METIIEIFDRAKLVEGIDSDYKLAKVLNTTGANISKWKAKSKIPYDVLHEYCERRHLSFEWLINGVGPIYINELEVSAELERLRSENQQLKADIKKIDEFIELVEERRHRNSRGGVPGLEGG